MSAENTNAGGVTLTDLHAANIARQAEWCPDQLPDLSFRGNELAGETGEACNVIKKLERERQGWRGSRATKDQLAEELADVVICADLCAVTAGIDLDAAVRDKFNATSEKVGLTTKLAALSAQSTGSGGVAAEPVAYKPPEGLADRVVSVPHPHWTGQWVVGWLFSDREEGRAAMRSLATLAADPSPASPAGDLNSLSAAIVGAMESYLRVCSSGGMPRDKRKTVEKAVRQAAKLGYFDALAAPAAPRKGPSEEEVARVRAFGQELSKQRVASLGPRDPGQWGLGYSRGFNDALDQVLAITPADRGETQAVGCPNRWATKIIPAGTKEAQEYMLANPCRFVGSTGYDVTCTTCGEYTPDYERRPLNCPKPPFPDQNRGEPDQGGANDEADKPGAHQSWGDL